MGEPVSYELDGFELELNNGSGWSIWRRDEHEVAAFILASKREVHRMLTGAETKVKQGDREWRCRLTPKSWLTS